MARKPYIAFCWASGLIQFGDQVPTGAIEICRGPQATVERMVSVAARHGREGKLLVPGVVEVSDEKLKGDALLVWLAWLAQRPGLTVTWNISPWQAKRFSAPATIDRVAKAVFDDTMRQVEAAA